METKSPRPSVTIILPVANERNIIASSLRHFCSLGADELIVVDGCSKDGTFETIRSECPGIRCLQTAAPDRALQMNAGAFEAKSDVLLFAHADIRLPFNALESVRSKIQAGFIGGGFRKCYTPENFLLKGYSFFQNLFFLSMAKSLVGTNAIFVKREIFEKMSGFPNSVFMEDVLFSEQLKKEGRLAIIHDRVLVSSRRYLTRGVLKQIWINFEILFRYKFLREDPSNLRESYEIT